MGSLRKKAVVIALDPGGTTGWSLMDLHPEVLVYPEFKIASCIDYWTHGQIDCGSKTGDRGTREAAQDKGGLTGTAGASVAGEAAGVAELIELIKMWPEAAIVIEDFILRQFRKDRDLLSPVRITAAISQYLWSVNRDYSTQQPSLAKSTMTDDRLKRMGLYRADGGLNHARDADRHAITFLRRCKMNPHIRAAAFPHLYGPDAPWNYKKIKEELAEEKEMA